MTTPANHYVVSGPGIDGTLDTAGLTGRPSVTLTVDGNDVVDPAFQVNDFGVQTMGIVSATEDAETVHIRLVVPQVNISDGDVPIEGVALLATARTSIGGPGLVNGAIQTYEVRTIVGTASAVEF